MHCIPLPIKAVDDIVLLNGKANVYWASADLCYFQTNRDVSVTNCSVDHKRNQLIRWINNVNFKKINNLNVILRLSFLLPFVIFILLPLV